MLEETKWWNLSKYIICMHDILNFFLNLCPVVLIRVASIPSLKNKSNPQYPKDLGTAMDGLKGMFS